jgi:hypothetical protein
MNERFTSPDVAKESEAKESELNRTVELVSLDDVNLRERGYSPTGTHS